MKNKLKKIKYNLAVIKGITNRRMVWSLDTKHYVKEQADELLASNVYKHKSLIRRTLGDVDPKLQENKAVNLSIAAPLVNGVIIKPGECFSLWRLVGKCCKAKGYKEGLVIRAGKPSSGIGGGMCQFSNLIHWMVLHSPLTIVEHHHHNQVDMFPDFGRTIPFGTGTSIMYNYLDYQFINTTQDTYQLLVEVDDSYLSGQLLCSAEYEFSYHVIEEDAYFIRRKDGIYRHNKIYRNKINKLTGDIVEHEFIQENNSKVLYDESYIDPNLIQDEMSV